MRGGVASSERRRVYDVARQRAADLAFGRSFPWRGPNLTDVIGLATEAHLVASARALLHEGRGEA